MAFIQRTRLVPKPKLEVPTRKLRFTSANTAATRALKTAVAREQINELMKLIAISDAEIDAAVARNDAAYAEIEKLLRANNLSSHSDGVLIAEIMEQFTRQSRIIDPKKYKAHVASDVFWASVKVSVTEAEKHLTEKELNAISDIVPAESMGYVFKCKRVARKTRK